MLLPVRPARSGQGVRGGPHRPEQTAGDRFGQAGGRKPLRGGAEEVYSEQPLCGHGQYGVSANHVTAWVSKARKHIAATTA